MKIIVDRQKDLIIHHRESFKEAYCEDGSVVKKTFWGKFVDEMKIPFASVSDRILK